jgi:hypothetical protein
MCTDIVRLGRERQQRRRFAAAKHAGSDGDDAAGAGSWRSGRSGAASAPMIQNSSAEPEGSRAGSQ